MSWQRAKTTEPQHHGGSSMTNQTEATPKESFVVQTEIEAIRERVAEQKTKPAPWVYLKDAETLLQALDDRDKDIKRFFKYTTILEARIAELDRKFVTIVGEVG